MDRGALAGARGRLGGDGWHLGSFAHDAAEVLQESLTFDGLLDEDGAPIGRVDLAASEFEFAEAIEGTGYGWLGDIQIGGETTNGVRAFLEVASQEDAELPGGKVRPIAPHERDGRFAKNTDHLIGYGINRHQEFLSKST